MWSKPIEMDTAQYPGPYLYKVYHGLNVNNVNTFIGPNLADQQPL